MKSTHCDSALKAALDQLLPQLAGGGSLNDSMRWGPLVQIGMNEQQNRETRRSNKTSRRVASVALVVSAASLLFTGIAVHYARAAAQSTERWEKCQNEQLEGLRREAATARVSLGKLEATMAAMAAARGSVSAKPRR